MRVHARAISYFLSIVAIAAIFFSIEFITEKFFYPDDEIVDILAAIIGALLFARCKRFFDRVTDRIFFRGPGDDRVEFITNISHELQTPIAILRGNVELLQRKSVTDAERASAERVIVGTLDGMSRMIGGVLESAKLKFSKEIGYKERIEAGSLLAEVREDCLLLAEDKSVHLSADVAGNEDGAIDIVVCGDRGKLKEVLLNLISNALKHTPRGGSVTLRAERTVAAARITVEDTGSGIAPEAIPHIFDRFYKIPNHIDAVPGNGIGLNICREIIEAHGGSIAVESEIGKGSRFIISLPLSPPARRPRGPGTPRSLGSSPASASAIINP